jgi:hypothetical protein
MNGDRARFSHNVSAMLFNERKGTRKHEKRLLWWCIYIGFILTFITVVVSFYFAVEFGGVFDLDKPISWLIGFIVSDRVHLLVPAD